MVNIGLFPSIVKREYRAVLDETAEYKPADKMLLSHSRVCHMEQMKGYYSTLFSRGKTFPVVCVPFWAHAL